MNSGNTYTVLSLLGSLVLFVLILVLAWFCVRWLGGQYRLNTAGSRVKVLERIALAPDRSLLVVRAGGQVLLLGVTSQHIEKIAELDPEEFPDEPVPTVGNDKLSAALEAVLKKNFTPGGKGNNPNE